MNCELMVAAALDGPDEAAPMMPLTPSLLKTSFARSSAPRNAVPLLRFESRNANSSCVLGSKLSATPSVLSLISLSAR
eukprot:7048860-Prymnesium_polylepis.1